MSQDDSYELKPPDKKPEPVRPKPGDPDWVEPVPIIETAEPPAEAEPPPDPDITNNKAMAILAYICFVIPVVAASKSPFARFHANQGLMVFILWCIFFFVSIFLEVIWKLLAAVVNLPGILWFFFGCVVNLVPVILLVGCLVYTIMGIINAANGEKKQLPLIGHWTLIK